MSSQNRHTDDDRGIVTNKIYGLARELRSLEDVEDVRVRDGGMVPTMSASIDSGFGQPLPSSILEEIIAHDLGIIQWSSGELLVGPEGSR